MQITSLHNPRIKAAVKLRDRKGRDEQRRIIIDGLREIGLAIAAGVKILELYRRTESSSDECSQLVAGAERAGAELIEVSPPVMEKLAFGNRAEGVVAVAAPPQRTLADLQLPAEALVAVVEGIEKPGNLGAILRTADAAGTSAVIVAGGVTDLYNPNAIRASLGAIFTVTVCSAGSRRRSTGCGPADSVSSPRGWKPRPTIGPPICAGGPPSFWAAKPRVSRRSGKLRISRRSGCRS
jgi:TrmH family RNA methyltransferase